ncbi:MAG: hypothetical protein II858_05690 [Bacteroidales bacterium]|nr:hypothetical protein [Bacteroidales bacterium]
MRKEEDRPIHLPVPFLKEGTVLFVSPDAADAPAPGRRPDRKGCLSLADLAASLSPELRAYFFPGVASDLTTAALYQRLQELAGFSNETGLLYRQDGVLYFHPMPEGVGEAALPSRTPQPAAAAANPRLRGFRRSAAPMIEATPCEEPLIDEESILFSVTEENECNRVEAPREAQDPRVQAILDAWEKIEREFGITIEDLQVLLGYQVKLSRLSITTSNRIFLTDFDNREVKMDDLTKALYFFFLRHPEGARLKELQDHEPEILRIYSGITGRDDPDKIRESVHNLLDPFANNLNVSLSRIKKAFRDVVGDRIARFYYISGSPAQPRTLPLDRDLVLWAH